MAGWTFYRLKSWILLQVEVKRSRCCAVHLQTSDISIGPSRASCCGSHRRRLPGRSRNHHCPESWILLQFRSRKLRFPQPQVSQYCSLRPNTAIRKLFCACPAAFCDGCRWLQYFPYSKQVSNPVSVGLHFKRSRVTRRRGSGGGRFNTCELACL